MPFRLVERISRVPTTGAYTARTLRVVGDHPDFEPETIQTPDGLFDGVMYVELSPNRMLSLEPFCSWLDCSMCLRSEVYYIDRVRDARNARLKSFDRGHPYESKQIADHLRHAGFGPPRSQLTRRTDW
jgi:type I restriction enzyme M protein